MPRPRMTLRISPCALFVTSFFVGFFAVFVAIATGCLSIGPRSPLQGKQEWLRYLPVPQKRLFQREISGGDVGIERVFAGAGFVNGTEEAAVIFAEGAGGNIAGDDGCFDVGIVGGIADGDGEIAGAEFNVLAAGDVLDGDVAGGNAGVEFGVARDADFDVEIIARAAGDVKFGADGGTGEAVTKVVDFVFVPSGDIDGQLSFVAADDADGAGANMKRDASAGGKLRFKMGDAALGDFRFVGGGNGQGHQGD